MTTEEKKENWKIFFSAGQLFLTFFFLIALSIWNEENMIIPFGLTVFLLVCSAFYIAGIHMLFSSRREKRKRQIKQEEQMTS